MAIIDIQVPDIGDFDEVTVIELLVKPGDTIKADQSLLTVESDKASMEIPSSAAGVVKALKVALGDKVKQGSVVLTLETADAATSSDKKTAVVQAVVAPEATKSPAPVPVPVPAPKATPTPVPAGAVELRVPDIGDFKNVSVIEVLVKVGDTIKVEQSLVTVESDKASMEIPASSAGVLKELKVKLGDTINIGDLLAVLEGSAVAAPAASAAPAAAAATAAVAAPAPSPVTGAAQVPAAAPAASVPPHEPSVAPMGQLPHASPSVR